MKNKFYSTAFIFIFLILLAGCSTPGAPKYDNGSLPFTGDDFNSYPVGFFVPPSNGWQSLLNKSWSIQAGGVTGNALFFAPNEDDCFIHGYDNSDYTVSVQIKHSLIPTNTYNASLIGRCDNFCSYYGCYIYTATSVTPHDTRLLITKNWKSGTLTYGVVLNDTHYFNGDIDPDIYYTLSLKFAGNVITSSVTDGVSAPVASTVTDDGSSHGPLLTSGGVGLSLRAAISFHPYFDNFTVTVP
jgi:hypothetical protein